MVCQRVVAQGAGSVHYKVEMRFASLESAGCPFLSAQPSSGNSPSSPKTAASSAASAVVTELAPEGSIRKYPSSISSGPSHSISDGDLPIRRITVAPTACGNGNWEAAVVSRPLFDGLFRKKGPHPCACPALLEAQTIPFVKVRSDLLR